MSQSWSSDLMYSVEPTDERCLCYPVDFPSYKVCDRFPKQAGNRILEVARVTQVS